MARAARDALRLDTVLFAPVGAQPLKPLGSTASFEDRVAMTALAIQGERGFVVSEIDAPDAAGEPNYTMETLRRLRAGLPDVALFCLMGADSFLTLRKWRRAEEIPLAAALIVASRPGQQLDDLTAALPKGLELQPSVGKSLDPAIELQVYRLRNRRGVESAFYVLPDLDVEISASEIRARVREPEGESHAAELVPEAVERFIREHGLYR